jgi:hypothetical protein
MSMMGASLRDRAARALHRAALRLSHPASIPCADVFERPIAVGLLGVVDGGQRWLEVYIQWANGTLDRVINSHAVVENVNHWSAVFPPLYASAIEARRVETEGLDAEHESAVPQADAKET